MILPFFKRSSTKTGFFEIFVAFSQQKHRKNKVLLQKKRAAAQATALLEKHSSLYLD